MVLQTLQRHVKKYKVNIFFNKLCLFRNERQLKETDPIFPVNNYAWSKLGGEASVHLYNNSLILRVSMTEKPFVHKEAFDNVKTSFIYQEAVVPILFRLLKKKGVINLGGKSQTIYNFAKVNNKKIKRVFLSKNKKIGIPFNSTLNLNKLNSLIKKR